MKYIKPPLTIDDQLNLLASRGMNISDRPRAFRYLSHISYFRLRGYWIPLEKPDSGPEHNFHENTSFDDVLNLYIFDRKFRLLILEAHEKEIDRSTELFIQHYHSTYDDPVLPPVWAAAEVMSFGQLSLWF
ncbi:MAG: Abi family protein, partial [Desulfobacteraceae bacterium]